MSKAYALRSCLRTACEFHVLAYGHEFTKKLVKEILQINDECSSANSEIIDQESDLMQSKEYISDSQVFCEVPKSESSLGIQDIGRKEIPKKETVKYNFAKGAWADLSSDEDWRHKS